VSTPIGNISDISIRAFHTLLSVGVIACEDTRRTGLLLTELKKRYASLISDSGGHEPRFIRCDEHTESNAVPQLINMLEGGDSVALVSNAGTPLLSDPGYILVHEAVKHGIRVVAIPGASAFLSALTASGLPMSHFLFLGFPPEKESHRDSLFHAIQSSMPIAPMTYILYCSPHKLTKTLHEMMRHFGDIPIVIAREITKIHEEIWHGTITKALADYSHPVGEFVILWYLPTR